MKVIFGDMDEMLSELKEREIFEVRVEALYEERYSKEGIPLIKVYVTVQALLPQSLYACYERVTFKGVKPSSFWKKLDGGFSPFTKDEMNSIANENLRMKDEITSRVKEAGFTVRAGHFMES
jgi:hypothetical protein